MKLGAALTFGTLTAALLARCSLAAQGTKALPVPTSPGAAIAAAAKAAAHNQTIYGPLEVLTDTQGVDFGPYSRSLISRVREHWHERIPSSAEQKKGHLVIEFTVLGDGKVADMKIVDASGDAELDRAAWRGISDSSPFPSLPATFVGDRIRFRFRFFYNEIPSDRHTHAALIQKTADEHPPQYPPNAAESQIEGVVRLEGKVQADGTIDDIQVLEGDATLAQASTEAIKRWRFHPAQRNLVPEEETVRILVKFRLEGKLVQARVVSDRRSPSEMIVQ